MKTLNLTFENFAFRKMKKLKKMSGLNWEHYIFNVITHEREEDTKMRM